MLNYSPWLLLGAILSPKAISRWGELSMEYTLQQGIQVSQRCGHLPPILAWGFCEPLEITLVEVAQVDQAVEFLVRLCGAETLSQLEALV